MATKLFKSMNLICRGSGASLNLFRYTAKSCDSQGVVTVSSYGASDEHPMSTRSASDGSKWNTRGNLIGVWKYAAMLLCLLMLGIGNAWAHGGPHYATVTAISTGNGKVYVTATNNYSVKDTDWQSEMPTSWNCGDNSNEDTKTYYFYANANDGYVFAGWGTSEATNDNPQTDNPAQIQTKAEGDKSNPTLNTYYAHFWQPKVEKAVCPEDINVSLKGDSKTATVKFRVSGAVAVNNFTGTPELGSEDFKIQSGPTFSSLDNNGNGEVSYVLQYTAGATHGESSATIELNSNYNNTSASCTVNANFPNITISGFDPEVPVFDVMPTEVVEGTAEFDVAYAATDGSEFVQWPLVPVVTSGYSGWTITNCTFADGKVTVNYSFDPNGISGNHAATLTLAATAAAGGASKTLNLGVVINEQSDKAAVVTLGGYEKEWDTFAEALADANSHEGCTLKLLNNCEVNASQVFTKSMTLDLNGFELKRAGITAAGDAVVLNTIGKTLYITDTKPGAKGSIVAVASSSVAVTGINVGNGCKLLMDKGTINVTTPGTTARGIYATTTPTSENMVVVSDVTINTTAASQSIGLDCASSSATDSGDPEAANVILSNLTINAETTGTTDAFAIRTAKGVALLVNSGTYTATAKTTTAYTLSTSGYTAIVKGTFNATAQTTTARAINVAAGITAIKAGSFSANAQTEKAHTCYVASGAKLLTYGGTFHGTLENAAANQYATGAYIDGTLEAQGGMFIGEVAKTGLASAQTNYAAGVLAAASANVTMSNATLRGLTDNTYVNGAYALYSKTTNPVNLTNCILEATSTYQYGYGVYNNGSSLTANNCEITVNTTYAYNYGVYNNSATANTEMVNSTLICTSGTTYAYGANVLNGTLTATDCTFSAETKRTGASSADNCQLYGINVASGQTATLTGCTINTTGSGTYSNNGYGIYVDGSVDVTDCEVTVSNINSGAYAIYNTANTTAINVYSGKFKATATSTGIESNATADAANQQLYGGYYVHNNSLAKYLPEGYMIETLTAGTEFSEGYNYHVRPEIVVPDPVCKIGSTGYATLEEALDFVNKNSGTAYTIYMVKDYTLPAGDYTLPANATLLVPMSGQTISIGTSLARVTSAETRSCNVQLTFATGVNITVYGTIETGSRQCAGSGATGYQTGSYGRIHMNEGSRIDMESGSKIYCWGYITGTGVINAKDGSTINELFELGDFKGGGVAKEMVNNSYKVFLVTHYFYQSIEADVIYRPGSQALGYTTAAINNSAQKADGVKIVGDIGSGSLFLMDAKDMREDTWLKKEYDPATERAVWTLNSGATLGSLSINISGVDMQSANYIFPISSQMDLKLNYGEMTLYQSTYFMPGATLEIGREATLKIPSGKELYFIDQEKWVTGYSVQQYICTPTFSPTRSGNGPRHGMKLDNTKIPDAEFFIHGTVEVTGSFFTSGTGANLHSTNADAGKVIFKSRAAADKSFYQCNSHCGKQVLLFYYWDRQEHACTSAKLKNGDGTYVATAGNDLGTQYIYKDDQWVKIVTDGCLEVQTVSGIDHKYAYTTSFIEVAENTSDNAYHDAAHTEGTSGCKYYVYTEKSVSSEGCVWREVTKEDAGLYKAVLPDHNGKINYYKYDADKGYWVATTVTITWNINGSTTDYTIGYGTKPQYLNEAPSKASTTTDYYTWTGWTKGSENGEFFAKDAELPVVTENTTFYAYFKADKFTFRATFNNYDGSLLETKLVAAGETPIYEGETPIKPSTTTTEYTFTGWSPELAAISNAPATYTAQFSEAARKYTVQWVDYNGTVIKTEKVAYGTKPTAPSPKPSRPNDAFYSYTFDAWTPAIAPVSGDQTYTANYNFEKKVTKYDIIFKNGTETVGSQSLPNGEIPVYGGTTPTKTPTAQYTYTFDGWSETDGGAKITGSLPAVSGANKTYYAHFATTTNNYRIIWKSEDGKVLYETDASIEYGATPEYNGSKPTKPRQGATVYTFDGWSARIGEAKIALPSVTGHATYYAHFSEETGFYADIVDATATSLTINTNVTGWSLSKWPYTINGTSYGRKEGSGDKQCNADRTITIPHSLAAGESLLISISISDKNHDEIISLHNYVIPHVYEGNAELSGTDANSIVFVRGGKLTVKETQTAQAVYVAPGAELEINGSLTVDKLVLRTSPWSAAILTNNGTLSAEHVYYSRVVADNSQYYQFGLPVGSATTSVVLSDGNAPAETSWILKEYSESARAANGISDSGANWKSLSSSTIGGGKGYELFSASAYYREYYFPVNLDELTNSVAVQYTPSKNPANSGWNMVTSPLTSVYKNNPVPEGITISILNPDGNYTQENPSVIYPAVPFAYQAAATGTLSFEASSMAFLSQASPAPRRAKTATEEPTRIQWIHVDLKDANGVGDQTSIYAHPTRYDDTYKTGIDVSKQSLTASCAIIYSSHAYGEMAFAGVADALLGQGVALTVYSPKEQELTFSLRDNNWLDRMESVWLIDNETGAKIDLLSSDYSYEAAEGTSRGRFFIQGQFKASQVATELEPTSDSSLKGRESRKVIINQKMFIEVNGRLYDATGKEVKR